MREHTFILRKIFGSEDRLALRYLYGGDVVQREELEFGTKSVQRYLVIVEEGDKTGTDLGNSESMLTIERISVGQGVAELDFNDFCKIWL